LQPGREALEDEAGAFLCFFCAVGLRDVDVDLGARLYGVQLDLLDDLFWAFGGAFFDKLGGTRADSVVGRVDVVVEGFLRVVAWG